MKILVCGGGGFIGGHLIKRLKNMNHQVFSADLKENEYSDANPLTWIEEHFSSYKVFIPKTLPSFCGGLVGHFSFESICYFEDSVVRKEQKNDMESNLIKKESETEFSKKIKKTFPDAELLKVTEDDKS